MRRPIDLPQPNRALPDTRAFPWFARMERDQTVLETRCAQELENWRSCQRAHHRCGVIGRLAMRPALEEAYATMRSAFFLASSLEESAS